VVAEIKDAELTKLNEGFEEAETSEILRWAWKTFGENVAATSSFQTQSMPLLKLISIHAPEIRIFFLDTGFHFPETHEVIEDLQSRLGLRIETLVPIMGHDGFKEAYGNLYETNPQMCCYLNKVEPLKRALRGYQAWISGIRRDQTPHRAGTPILRRQDDGVIKICPMANWTGEQVARYVEVEDLPAHPLSAKGYRSIGCAPCTRPVSAQEEDDRVGRWSGQEQTECGLHFEHSIREERSPE